MTTERPTVRELSVFLSRYSAWLLGSGATCIRLERNVNRMASAYGKEVELTITPAHVHISVWEKDNTDIVTSIAAVRHSAPNFDMNTRLSRLSWEVADEKISFAGAIDQFDSITSTSGMNGTAVLLLVALANASFCRLFGGDFTAMAIVAVATAAGYYLKLRMLSRHFDARLTVLLCSFVSAIFGATGLLFTMGATPDVALGTSVLYLVPGIPFLNSFSDMLCRYYLCALSRFCDAVVTTSCLSAGLCAGMWLMGVGMF